MKFREEAGEDMNSESICKTMGQLDQKIARTSHIHADTDPQAPIMGQNWTNSGVQFVRPDISGGKFKIKLKTYPSDAAFKKSLVEGKKLIQRLQEEMDINRSHLNMYQDALGLPPIPVYESQ